MLFEIRFTDADRERLGCGEWLPVDPTDVSVREAIAMQTLRDQADKVLFPTPDQWREALVGQTVTGDDGQQRRELGPKYPWAVLIFGWLALRRAGHEPDLLTLEFSYDRSDLRAVEEPGKGDSTPDTTSTS